MPTQLPPAQPIWSWLRTCKSRTTGCSDSYLHESRIGWGRGVALNQDLEQHRKYRKLISKVLNSGAVRRFLPLEQRAAEAFLRDLYRTPEDFMKHIRNAIGNMIVELSYGRDTKIEGAGYIDYAEYVHEVFAYAARSFAFAVDILPACKPTFIHLFCLLKRILHQCNICRNGSREWAGKDKLVYGAKNLTLWLKCPLIW